MQINIKPNLPEFLEPTQITFLGIKDVIKDDVQKGFLVQLGEEYNPVYIHYFSEEDIKENPKRNNNQIAALGSQLGFSGNIDTDDFNKCIGTTVTITSKINGNFTNVRFTCASE